MVTVPSGQMILRAMRLTEGSSLPWESRIVPPTQKVEPPGAWSLSPRHCSHANPVNLSRTSTLVRSSIRWLRSDQGLRDICDVRADGLRLDAELDESFRAEPRVTGVHR